MDMTLPGKIRGIIFDKDGTLFNFQQSWSSWMATVISLLSGGDDILAAKAGKNLGFDLAANRFEPDSPFVAGTPESTLQILLDTFPDLALPEINNVLHEITIHTPQVEVIPLRPFMLELVESGFALGIATNDHESTAILHLKQANVLDQFAFIAGSDSGHGAKPDAGMLHAFCELTGISPGQAAIVGDSIWDLLAGRTAGMVTVGVLTGTSSSQVLSPYADVILSDIGELPRWLGMRVATVGV